MYNKLKKKTRKEELNLSLVEKRKQKEGWLKGVRNLDTSMKLYDKNYT